MRIKSFKCKNLHGYISKELTFNDGLTILTGINGTGKTSIIQSITALTNINIKILLSWDFEYMSVDISENGDHRIEAISSGKSIRLTFDESSIDISRMPNDNYAIDIDSIIERIEMDIQGNKAFESLKSMSTPLILGIDRKYDEGDLRISSRGTATRRSPVRRRAITDSIQDAMRSAISLVESKYRGIKFSLNKSSEILKTQIVSLSIKNLPKITLAKEVQPNRDWNQLRNQIDLAIDTFKRIGVSNEDTEILNHVYDSFHENCQHLKGITRFEDLRNDQSVFEAFMNVQFLTPSMEYIEALVSRIEENKKTQDKIERPIRQFKEVMNSFLKESHKLVDFSPIGELTILSTSKAQSRIRLNGLSSGEAQLTAIFCILGFQDTKHKSSAVIIDEPELSLHIIWQENFIPALLKISPDSQLIIATHSPSIIGERTDSCIDVADCDY